MLQTLRLYFFHPFIVARVDALDAIVYSLIRRMDQSWKVMPFVLCDATTWTKLHACVVFGGRQVGVRREVEKAARSPKRKILHNGSIRSGWCRRTVQMLLQAKC